MNPEPLRRKFNAHGPNYAPSGLDSPVRQAERRHVRNALVGGEEYDFEPMIARTDLVCYWKWLKCEPIKRGSRYMLGVGKEFGLNCCAKHWDQFTNQPTSGFRDEPGAVLGGSAPGSVGATHENS